MSNFDFNLFFEHYSDPLLILTQNAEIIKYNQQSIRIWPKLIHYKGVIDPGTLFDPDSCRRLLKYLEIKGNSGFLELLKADNQQRLRGRIISCQKVEANTQYMLAMEPSIKEKDKTTDTFFKKIVEQSNDIIVYFDRNFICKYINPSCYSISGYTASELVDGTLQELIYEEDKKSFFNFIRQDIKAKGEESTNRFRFIKKDGTISWIESWHHREFDESGNHIGVIVYLKPIEKQLNAEKKLKDEERKIRLITDSVSDVITWLDSEGKILFQSPSLKMTLGYEPAQFKQFSEIFKLIHPDDLQGFKKIRKRSILKRQENFMITYRLRDRTGNYRWIETHVRNRFYLDKLDYVVLTSRDITNRKKAEEELLNSELKYRYLADNSSDVIIRIDNTEQATYVSPSSIHLIGYTLEEIIERNDLLSFTHPTDRKRMYQERQASIDKGEIKQVQQGRLIHKDGTVVWVEIVIRRELDKDSKLIQSISTHRDITDRVKSRQQVEEIKDRYELAVEAGHTGVFDYNFITENLHADDSLLRLLGFPEKLSSNDPIEWLKYIYPDDRKTVVDNLKMQLKEGRSYIEDTFRVLHRRGVILSVLGRGKVFYKSGKPARIVSSITDITERIEANEQLKEAIVNFESIFNALPDLFFKFNKLGDYLDVKAGTKFDLMLKDFKAYKGKNIREVLPGQAYNILYRTLKRSFESSKVQSCNYSLEQDGITKHFEARVISVGKDEAIALVRNTSEAVRINQELAQAKKTAEDALNAREMFFSTMNHEIRTPLNVVIGMTHLLLNQEPREDQLKLLNTLKFSSGNLHSLINGLLDFSKMQAGKIVFENRDFNLIEFIDNIYESYSLSLQDKPVEMVKNWDRDLPECVAGDSNRLAQILNNLLNNAIKFTEEGQIQLGIQLVDKNKDRINLQFIIEDTGIGIPSNRIGKIFDPYQQATKDTARKYGGTGLGLTIIKQLVDLQGGTIGVKSKIGVGSVFTVMLPFSRPSGTVMANHRKGEALKHTLKDMEVKILYADDVLSNQFLMKGYCDKWGVKLETASNGKAAVDLLENTVFDLILLDLQMPQMDGFEAAELIREREKDFDWHTPIVAVTGDIQEGTRERIFQAGMNDVIVKPIDPEILFDIITESVQKSCISIGMLNSTNLPEKDQEIIDEKKVIDFTRINDMYNGVPELYNELMHLIIQEYDNNRQIIVKSIRESDFDTFREIKHSMTSNMKLFSMQKMQSKLEEIKRSFENNTLPSGGGDYPQILETCFEELLYQFELKQQQILARP